MISTLAPREGSDIVIAALLHEDHSISTLAPREGSDRLARDFIVGCLDFYPRSPRGERQICAGTVYNYIKFLPSLPARGATAKPTKFPAFPYGNLPKAA